LILFQSTTIIVGLKRFNLNNLINMRKFIVFILLIFTNVGFSQNLNINISLGWKNEIDYLSSDTTLVEIPYLKITYTNLSLIPIYFPKKTFNAYNLPYWSKSIGLDQKDKILKNALKEKNYSTNPYFVEMDQSFYENSWFVYDISLQHKKTMEVDPINEYLSNIYESLFYCMTIKSGNINTLDKNLFSPIRITKESILNDNKDYFLFLKQNESHTDYFNLYGFQSLGGEFYFSFRNNMFFKYVVISNFNLKTKKYEMHKVILPENINGYKLYSDKFLFNELKINFPVIK